MQNYLHNGRLDKIDYSDKYIWHIYALGEKEQMVMDEIAVEFVDKEGKQRQQEISTRQKLFI